MTVSVSLRLPRLGFPRLNLTNQSGENPASEYLLGTWPIASIACPSSQPEHNHVIHRYLTRRHTSWAGQRGRALCNSSSTFLALLDTSRLEENPP